MFLCLIFFRAFVFFCFSIIATSFLANKGEYIVSLYVLLYCNMAHGGGVA